MLIPSVRIEGPSPHLGGTRVGDRSAPVTAHHPLISVVTPSFNQAAYLETTIRSVLEQGYPNLEYLVIDGGSTDGSVDIIKKYADRLTYWVSEPDSGQSNAINKGFARATGELLAWLNSDDYYMPGALHAFAEAAVAHPDADFFVGIGRAVDVNGRILFDLPPPENLGLESTYRWLDRGDFLQPSAIFRRRIWERAEPIDEDIHFVMDVDLWLRMAKAGCRFHLIDAVLSSALVHAAAKTTAYTHLMRVDCSLVIAHGGAEVAHRSLDRMAMQLARCEATLERLRGNRFAICAF